MKPARPSTTGGSIVAGNFDELTSPLGKTNKQEYPFATGDALLAQLASGPEVKYPKVSLKYQQNLCRALDRRRLLSPAIQAKSITVAKAKHLAQLQATQRMVRDGTGSYLKSESIWVPTFVATPVIHEHWNYATLQEDATTSTMVTRGQAVGRDMSGSQLSNLHIHRSPNAYSTAGASTAKYPFLVSPDVPVSVAKEIAAEVSTPHEQDRLIDDALAPAGDYSLITLNGSTIAAVWAQVVTTLPAEATKRGRRVKVIHESHTLDYEDMVRSKATIAGGTTKFTITYIYDLDRKEYISAIVPIAHASAFRGVHGMLGPAKSADSMFALLGDLLMIQRAEPSIPGASHAAMQRQAAPGSSGLEQHAGFFPLSSKSPLAPYISSTRGSRVCAIQATHGAGKSIHDARDEQGRSVAGMKGANKLRETNAKRVAAGEPTSHDKVGKRRKEIDEERREVGEPTTGDKAGRTRKLTDATRRANGEATTSELSMRRRKEDEAKNKANGVTTSWEQGGQVNALNRRREQGKVLQAPPQELMQEVEAYDTADAWYRDREKDAAKSMCRKLGFWKPGGSVVTVAEMKQFVSNFYLAPNAAAARAARAKELE